MSDQNLPSSETISQVLDSLKTKVSEFNYNNCFRDSEFTLNDKREVQINVASKFIRDWIIEHYLEVIKFEFYKITGFEHQVFFKVVGPDKPKTQPSAQPASKPKRAPTADPRQLTLTAAADNTTLSARYSFDNFVVGNSNQFVHAACKAVAANPARNYNPLFIYGGVGLGKTHLLNAIGTEILKQNPHQKIIFVTGEQFTNEVINSIRYDKTYNLRKKYRQCDLLLIDDVQFIAGKERTMEEFFHTFNALYEGRKQIIMSSDTLPKDIRNLEERLRSRFGWGLLADIQTPDFETRCAILRKKAETEDIHLPDDVCEFMATHIKTNVRDLEGSLIRTSAFADLAKVPMSLSLAQEVLKSVLTSFSPSLSIASIQKIVADHFSLSLNDLKSARRHKKIALPRQMAMYLCKKHIQASFPEIGRQFGGKDHTTVIHAYQKVKKTIASDTALSAQLEQLEKMITQPELQA